MKSVTKSQNLKSHKSESESCENETGFSCAVVIAEIAIILFVMGLLIVALSCAIRHF